MDIEKHAGVIMVVDDQPHCLSLLEEVLQQQGYRVRSFPRGCLALASALQLPPDLILLDIDMPEMNGYEVCERLSCHEQLSHIPVIFLSALDDVRTKVSSFERGGVDYVTKPFQLDELHTRVRTHMMLSTLRRELKARNECLETLVRLHRRELDAANRQLQSINRAKDDLLRMIAHELNTPLNGILGVCQLLMAKGGSGEADPKLQSMFERSRQRILTMIDDARVLTEIEMAAGTFAPAPVALSSVVELALAQVAKLAACRQVKIESTASDLGFVVGVQDMLVRALSALLEMAVKLSGTGGAVQLSFRSGPERIQIEIESRGLILSEMALLRLFDMFAIPESTIPGVDWGLSPYMANRILSLLGGSVTAQNQGDSGVRMTVALPAM